MEKKFTFHKASKTSKIPNNSDNGETKFVTDRHPKTTSNLLKSMIQSKIITQEL